MKNSIIDSFDIWTNAQGLKSKGRVKSIDNISLEGLARLRELILDLAIRGKLVPQDAKDEPAKKSISKAEKETATLVKEGKLRKIKPLPAVEEDEQPFDLPNGWEFVRLNQVGEWGAGATPNRSNPSYYGGNIPWFKSGELVGDYIDTTEEFVTELALKETSLRYNSVGDVLLAMYGATIGKTSILKVRATTNQAVCACTPFSCISNVFLLTLMKAYKGRFTNMGAGGAQPNISREKIIATVIGLPPLAEQKRIVAKVDELMALCDLLEAKQTQQLKTHQQLVKALLATLVQAQNAEEVSQAWQRLEPHFDTLFCTEDSIDQLQQTILQLAVMGRLVPQKPADEPASVLLKKIAKEKAQLVKEGKIKKDLPAGKAGKPLPPITEEEKPFALPEGWEWCRLGEVGVLSTGKTPSTNNSAYFNGEIPFIGPGQINNEGFIAEPEKYLTESGCRLSTEANEGDILMVCIGGTIGKSAIVTKRITFNQQLNCIRPVLVETNYINFIFQSPYFRQAILSKATGSATPIINRGKWEEIAIPLSSLSLQNRIITKVLELVSFCDQLRQRLAKSQELQNALAETVVEGVVG